jgi:rare lipoprotein A (peptidoglycan hydrolase)
MSAIQADQRDNEATYVKPVQDQRALYYAQQLGKTYGDEAARNRLASELQVDLAANRISGTAAVSIQTSLSAQGSKEVRSYDKDINKRIDEMSTKWDKYAGSAGSYGDSAITGFESSAKYKARDDARRKSLDTVQQAITDGKDPVEALNKLWATNNWGLRYKDEPASTGIYDNGAQLMQKNTGNWSRPMDSTAARKLKDASKGGRPLYKKDPFVTDVDAYLRGNPSQNFRTLLKTLSTGSGGQKPSEVILNQLRLHQIDVPDDARQRLTALDNEQVSMAPPSRRLTPQQNPALDGIQIAGRAMGDLLAPSAQAQAMPSPRPGSVNNFPTRVTQVGYYAGGGGQDGVAGGRTANGEIYNPKKMTVAVQWTLRDKLLNKWLLVQDSKSGKTIRVWANDVGPLVGDDRRTGARHLDLSSAAFIRLFGSTRQGLGNIKYKIDPNQSGRP